MQGHGKPRVSDLTCIPKEKGRDWHFPTRPRRLMASLGFEGYGAHPTRHADAVHHTLDKREEGLLARLGQLLQALIQCVEGVAHIEGQHPRLESTVKLPQVVFLEKLITGRG